jgi:hypothetical protein
MTAERTQEMSVRINATALNPIAAVFLTILLFSPAAADEFDEVVGKLPDAGRCSYFKSEFSDIDSEENRAGIGKWLGSIMSEGEGGAECRQVRKEREEIEGNDARDLSGISRFSRERVYAWAGVCAIDLCDSGGAVSESDAAEDQTDAVPDGNENVGGSSGNQSAFTSPPAGGWGTARFCNKSSAVKYLAVGLPQGAATQKIGWYTINIGDCKSIRATTYVMDYYATGGGVETDGGAGYPLCVRKSPFNETVAKGFERTCPSGWTKKGFTRIPIEPNRTTTISITTP